MMDVMTWTVLQLMTDTEILLQQAHDRLDLEEYRLAMQAALEQAR